MNNFDLKKFLIENKLTSNSRISEVSGDIDLEDFAKVVQAVHQTDHPATLLLSPMFGKDEIEIIVGQDAPDSVIDDIFNVMTDLGYKSGTDYSIVGDSSTLSRRSYSQIRRVNGGHTVTEELNESEKLTYNDFVRMVRDDMMAGAAPDERPSEELVRKRAKAYYNDYLQGASLEDLFESVNENVTTTVWSNFDLQFMIDNNVRMLQGIGGNLQVDWHLIEKGFYGAEEKALKQVADWKESMEESLGIEPQEEVKIVGGKITTDKIEAASDEAAATQASGMKKGGFSNN